MCKNSVVVLFCYTLISKQIRRVRYLTIFDFRQVHLESVKNDMLSQVKTFDRRFLMELCFYQSQYNIENCFLRYLRHDKDSKRIDSKKSLIYRETFRLSRFRTDLKIGMFDHLRFLPGVPWIRKKNVMLSRMLSRKMFFAVLAT